MTNLAVDSTTGSISTIPGKQRGYNKTVSWLLLEAYHGASLHYLMVLQATSCSICHHLSFHQSLSSQLQPD